MTVPYDGPLAGSIGEWADSVLRPYLERFPKNPYRERKEIHDAVAGIVQLQQWETFILDSPLMQRLRFIRQLGVGHLLFPTSGYSRFEHSIGAVRTASEMFDAVCGTPASPATSPAVQYSPDQLIARRDVVRLAALLHDVGHCVFSHVSERFYGRDSELQKAATALSTFYDSNVTAGETVSLLILHSPAFKKLLDAALIRRLEFSEDRIIQLVGACIAGSKRRVSPDCFMAEIVNGPVDCDKLDYLARDAHMAGVPISLDIPRLLSKLRPARVKGDDGTDLYALAIVQSGTRALDELLVSRIFLYDKFYYHPKVMAAEELVRRALFHVSSAIPALGSPEGLLQFGDDEFLSLTPADLGRRYGVETSSAGVERACKLLGRLKARDLPKRAFAFAARFLPELPELLARLESDGKPQLIAVGQYEYKQLVRRLENPNAKETCAEQIRVLAAQLGAATDVFVGIQSAGRAAGNVYLPVLLPDGEVDEKPSFLFKTSEWTEAYALNKQTQYVFADGELEKVYLAAERYFLGQDLSFAPNSSLVAKMNRTDIQSLRSTLSGDWIPHRLQPDLLTTDAIQERIQEQQRRFASWFNALHPDLGELMVEAWLFQFPDADLRESGLRLLEHITYVEAYALVAGFRTLVSRSAQLRESLWVPFRPRGGRGKSADQLWYDLKDLKVASASIAGLSADAVTSAGRIVFFDDSLNSGVQASCLLGSWFSRQDLCKHGADLDPSGPLPGDLQTALRGVPIEFVYYAAHPTGRASLLNTAATIGLGVERITSVVDTSEAKYRIDGLRCDSIPSKTRLLEFLRNKGSDLLFDKIASHEPEWNKQKTRDYALGYGGLDLTVVFRHSISTCTPVVLWKPFFDKTNPWLPLFPRKNKEDLVRRLDPTFGIDLGQVVE